MHSRPKEEREDVEEEGPYGKELHQSFDEMNLHRFSYACWFASIHRYGFVNANHASFALTDKWCWLTFTSSIMAYAYGIWL